MDLNVVPGERLGPFVLGAAESELERVFRSVEGLVEPAPFQPRPRGTAHYDFRMTVKARIDRGGRVESVQVSGSGASESFRVRFRGVDLLGAPAHEVMHLLSQVDEIQADEFGYRVVAPHLGIVLARSVVPDDEDDEEGRYFTAVLIARQGSMDLEL
jgi:hypothetical protein